MIESNDFTGDPYEVELGTPFTYLENGSAINQYYFPVIYNGNINYVYRVYEDVILYEETGELQYVSSMSSVLAEKFTELAKKTSSDVPAILTVENYNILANIGSQVEIIAEDLLAESNIYTNNTGRSEYGLTASYAQDQLRSIFGDAVRKEEDGSIVYLYEVELIDYSRTFAFSSQIEDDIMNIRGLTLGINGTWTGSTYSHEDPLPYLSINLNITSEEPLSFGYDVFFIEKYINGGWYEMIDVSGVQGTAFSSGNHSIKLYDIVTENLFGDGEYRIVVRVDEDKLGALGYDFDSPKYLAEEFRMHNGILYR